MALAQSTLKRLEGIEEKRKQIQGVIDDYLRRMGKMDAETSAMVIHYFHGAITLDEIEEYEERRIREFESTIRYLN